MPKFRCHLLLVSLFFLLGCSTNTGQIGSNLSLCCPGNYGDYAAYGLTTNNIPAFLRDYLVSEFDAAFQEKGIVRNDQTNDIRVSLTYNHVNLRSDQEEIDPFVTTESIVTEISYLAVIEIAMVESVSGNPVWGGSISRMHQVTPGEYMHEEGAREQFRLAFREVLASYPPL